MKNTLKSNHNHIFKHIIMRYEMLTYNPIKIMNFKQFRLIG